MAVLPQPQWWLDAQAAFAHIYEWIESTDTIVATESMDLPTQESTGTKTEEHVENFAVPVKPSITKNEEDIKDVYSPVEPTSSMNEEQHIEEVVMSTEPSILLETPAQETGQAASFDISSEGTSSLSLQDPFLAHFARIEQEKSNGRIDGKMRSRLICEFADIKTSIDDSARIIKRNEALLVANGVKVSENDLGGELVPAVASHLQQAASEIEEENPALSSGHEAQALTLDVPISSLLNTDKTKSSGAQSVEKLVPAAILDSKQAATGVKEQAPNLPVDIPVPAVALDISNSSIGHNGTNVSEDRFVNELVPNNSGYEAVDTQQSCTRTIKPEDPTAPIYLPAPVLATHSDRHAAKSSKRNSISVYRDPPSSTIAPSVLQSLTQNGRQRALGNLTNIHQAPTQSVSATPRPPQSKEGRKDFANRLTQGLRNRTRKEREEKENLGGVKVHNPVNTQKGLQDAQNKNASDDVNFRIKGAAHVSLPSHTRRMAIQTELPLLNAEIRASTGTKNSSSKSNETSNQSLKAPSAAQVSLTEIKPKAETKKKESVKKRGMSTSRWNPTKISTVQALVARRTIMDGPAQPVLSEKKPGKVPTVPKNLSVESKGLNHQSTNVTKANETIKEPAVSKEQIVKSMRKPDQTFQSISAQTAAPASLSVKVQSEPKRPLVESKSSSQQLAQVDKTFNHAEAPKEQSVSADSSFPAPRMSSAPMEKKTHKTEVGKKKLSVKAAESGPSFLLKTNVGTSQPKISDASATPEQKPGWRDLPLIPPQSDTGAHTPLSRTPYPILKDTPYQRQTPEKDFLPELPPTPPESETTDSSPPFTPKSSPILKASTIQNPTWETKSFSELPTTPPTSDDESSTGRSAPAPAYHVSDKPNPGPNPDVNHMQAEIGQLKKELAETKQRAVHAEAALSDRVKAFETMTGLGAKDFKQGTIFGKDAKQQDQARKEHIARRDAELVQERVDLTRDQLELKCRDLEHDVIHISMHINPLIEERKTLLEKGFANSFIGQKIEKHNWQWVQAQLEKHNNSDLECERLKAELLSLKIDGKQEAELRLWMKEVDKELRYLNLTSAQIGILREAKNKGIFESICAQYKVLYEHVMDIHRAIEDSFKWVNREYYNESLMDAHTATQYAHSLRDEMQLKYEQDQRKWNRTLAEKDKTISELEVNLAGKARIISSYQKTYNSNTKLIAKVNAQLAEKEEIIRELKAQHEATRDTIIKLKAKFEAQAKKTANMYSLSNIHIGGGEGEKTDKPHTNAMVTETPEEIDEDEDDIEFIMENLDIDPFQNRLDKDSERTKVLVQRTTEILEGHMEGHEHFLTGVDTSSRVISPNPRPMFQRVEPDPYGLQAIAHKYMDLEEFSLQRHERQ